MYKYIVTWTIFVATVCPDYKPDEFGRYPNVHCDVYHMKQMPMKKEFYNRDSAVNFHDRGNTAMPNQFEIDSVIIKLK